MGVTRYVRATGLGLGLAASVAGSVGTAAETAPAALQGAWLQQSFSCARVYSPAGKSVSFIKPVNAFAPAFIISGRRLRTPLASCRIRLVKPGADRQVLALDCATTVAANEVVAFIAPMPDGTLSRFADDEDRIGTPYKRCFQ